MIYFFLERFYSSIVTFISNSCNAVTGFNVLFKRFFLNKNNNLNFLIISPFIYSSENIFVFYKIINCMTFVKQTLMAIIKLKFLFFEQDFFFKILDLKIQQLAAHQHCHYLISLLKVQIK